MGFSRLLSRAAGTTSRDSSSYNITIAKTTRSTSVDDVSTGTGTTSCRSATEKYTNSTSSMNEVETRQLVVGGMEVNGVKHHHHNGERVVPSSSSPPPLFQEEKLNSQVPSASSKTTTMPVSTKPAGRPTTSFYADFSPLATNKILSSLERYDQDLAAIITKRSNGGSTTTGRITAVDRHDLQRVRLLGTGHFSNVYLVTGSLPEDSTARTTTATGASSSSSSSELEQQDQQTMLEQRRTTTPRKKKQMYAYKAIDPTRACNTDELVSAARDLATEALFLSQLEHDNIIQLRGMCSEPFSKTFVDDAIFNTVTDLNGSFLQHQQHTDRDSSSSKNSNSSSNSNSNNELEGYFLVMDVLAETLSQRLNRWRKNERNHEKTKEVSLSGAGADADAGRRGSLFRCFTRSSTAADTPIVDPQKLERMYDRVECVGLGIAKGMEYLASKGIVLRDLKPGNVGFDEDDCDTTSKVKLFDFGMARQVEQCDPGEICGSPRYMAPESMCGDGYTLKVDVYSFGILLFELCSLIVPFSDLFCNRNNNNNGNSTTNKKKSLSIGSRHLRPLSKASSPLWKKIVNGTTNRCHRREKSYSPNCNNSTTNESSKFNTSHTSTSNTAATANNSDHRTRMTEEFYRQVVDLEIRPTDNIDFLSAVPCPRLRSLIVECWQSDPTKRPSFQEIVPRLQDILFCYKQQ